MSGNVVATVNRTSSKKGSPWKTLVYTQQRSDSTERLPVPRSACVTKGDTIEIIDDDEIYVRCKHGDGKAQILPSYSEEDEIRLGSLTIPVSVKEITEVEEYQAYQHLQLHHYRGKLLFGRHVPLVMRLSHPLLPSVVGYIELATPFLVSKPRHELFNTACKLNDIRWEQWNNETSRKYISLFVRIARCVVHPELRGTGLGQKLVKHSIQFAKTHWQSGGCQPYVLEICADMLRYVPFAENAGMIYIGETEGNRHRIAEDFSYFIKYLERFENKEILPDDSCGIVDVKRSQFQALLDSDPNKTHEQALADLQRHIRHPTLKRDAKFKSVIVFPKPVYVKGLHADAEAFISKRVSELKLHSEAKMHNALALESIKTPIQLDSVVVEFENCVRRTQLTSQVEKAFGVSLDTLIVPIFRNLTVSILPKTIWLITGLSGTGKTTFLKLLNEEILPSDGFLDMPENAKIGTLSPIRSKKTMIEFFGKGDINRGLQLMNSVGLSEVFLYVKTFQQLSTGQKYRAMLANLLSTESNIWLIDEFCESLDPITTNLIAGKLCALARKRHATVVVSATNISFLRALQPDNILLLHSEAQHNAFTFDEFQEFIERSNPSVVQEDIQSVYR